MREDFECGLYKGEEYHYWQKISTLKERLNLLEHIPESVVNRAANTLLDLRETWENSTKEERKDLVHIMLKKVGVDAVAKCGLWVKPQPDYEPLVSILGGYRSLKVRSPSCH